MNPTAIAFWLFCTGIGGLIGDWRGALAGLVIGVGFSLLMSLLHSFK